MPVLLLILWWWYFSCLEMYWDKFFNIYFHEQMFFQIFVEKAKTGQFLLINNNFWALTNLQDFFTGHGFDILIQKYFSNEWFVNLGLIKVKQQEGIQLPSVFQKIYMNQFSNQFSLFLHFLDLLNLQSVT